MARVGAAIVLVAVLAAVLGPWLVPFDPSAQELALRLEGPTGAHWFGLDELGRDIFARVLGGARISLLVVLSTSCWRFRDCCSPSRSWPSWARA